MIGFEKSPRFCRKPRLKKLLEKGLLQLCHNALKTLRNLFPPFLVLLIFLADFFSSQFLGDQTFAPPLAVLSLFALAFFLGAKSILLWTPVFAAVAYALILDISQFPLTRTITVVLAGLMSAWASRLRERSIHQAAEIELVLQNLPTPWVLIDAKGSIMRGNCRGATLLGSSQEEIAGLSIFEGSGDPQNQKERIRRFVQASEKNLVFTLSLGVIRGTGKNLVGKVFPVALRSGRASLLVLEEVDP